MSKNIEYHINFDYNPSIDSKHDLFEKITKFNESVYQTTSFREDYVVKISEFIQVINDEEKITSRDRIIFNIIHTIGDIELDYEGDTIICFKNIQFENSLIFPNEIKCQLEFEDCSFDKTVYLNDRKAIKPIIFKGVEFVSKFRGDSSEFLKGISFRYCNFKGKVQFSNTIVKSLANFDGASFSENGYFYKARFDKLDLRYTVISKDVFYLDSKVKSANKETFRIIKNQFISQNNKIESLRYYAKEMRSYTYKNFINYLLLWVAIIVKLINLMNNIFMIKLFNKVDRKIRLIKYLKGNEFIQDLKGADCFIQFFTLPFKLLILSFNLISNYFGLHWVQSLLVFLAITCWQFDIYINELNPSFTNDLKSILNEKGLIGKYYMQFIDPTSSVDLDVLTKDLVNGCEYKHHKIENTTESFKTQFYSRIIASLGIYQTIQAFRKYSFK